MTSPTQGGAVAGKRSNMSQKRIYWFIALGLTCAFLIIIGIAVPISIYQARDHSALEERWREEINEADRWASVLRSTVIDSISVAHAFEGFALGSLTEIPPFNGTVEDRMKNQYFTRFYDVASMLNSSTKFIAMFILAPGGVVTQTLPRDSSSVSYDFLLPKNELGEPKAIESIDKAQFAVLGPMRRPISFLDVEWQLIVRDPIYNVSDITNASRDNFWGFAMIIQDVDAVLNANKLDESTKAKGIDYLIYTIGRNPERIVPIRFSLKKDPTVDEMMEFINSGTNRSVLRNRLSWFVCTRSVYQEPQLTKTTIVIIVLTSLFGSLLIFLIAAAIVLICLREYDGRLHAPKMAPFAMIIIGPCSGEQLWELAPEQMVGISEKFAEIQKRAIVRYRAYEGMQLHPYTTTIITRTMEAAVHLCFSILEELHSQPIDAPLRDLLGEDGRLLIASTVHWCMEANVNMETINGNIRYEGNDIIYGGRMWVFAAPNEVTISQAAREAASHLTEVKILPLGSVFLRGVPERQDLFTIHNTFHKKLRGRQKITSIVPFIPNSQSSMEGASEEGNPLSLGNNNNHNNNHNNNSNSNNSGGVGSGHIISFPGNETEGIRSISTSIKSAGDSCAGAAGCNRVNSKKSNQIHVPKTLIELMPTEAIVTGDPMRESYAGTPPTSSLTGVNTGVFKVPTGEEVNNNYNNNNNNSTQHRNNSNTKNHTPNPLQPEEQEEQKSGRTSANIDKTAQKTTFVKKENNTNNTSGIYKRTPVNSLHSGGGGGGIISSGNSMILNHDTRYITNCTHDGDFVTEALLHPKIPTSVDTHLRAVFEQQSVAFDLSYDSVRTIIYYFFSAFKVLLKPLAGPERSNIFHRFVIAFGVPIQNILEHLAVRCALRHIRQIEETRSLLWNCEQQLRLQFLTRHNNNNNNNSNNNNSNSNNNGSSTMNDSSVLIPVTGDSLLGSLSRSMAS